MVTLRHEKLKFTKVCSHLRVKAFLAKIPNGWLVRCMYDSTRVYKRSAILFFPDSKEKWVLENLEIKWETISETRTANHVISLSRLKTPEGWVVKEFMSTRFGSSQYDGTTTLNLTYVDDIEHKWIIT
ncbi:hypothetical protein [Desulfobotulus mexicanus]|uniref:Uncharacterized protein n=1 Tax=Desulfobotulus mexicanus TaxID=2586642 RepID=A0A5S5MET8_9BACT|nr:hypothetical protein [Desulfobotulus mexicanus]TYT74189.1 hypothetical protein FIM25_11435 [Desulfobotulus mexicanus]